MDFDGFFLIFQFFLASFLPPPPNFRGTPVDPSRHTSVPGHTGGKSLANRHKRFSG
jgi:hypothetical protein